MKKILGILIIFMVFFTVNVEAANDKIILKGITISAKSDTITVEEPTVENNTINLGLNNEKIEIFSENKMEKSNDTTIGELMDDINKIMKEIAADYDF